MSEIEQRRDAGMDTRGRATQGVAKARRSAWLLGGLALFFYFGYLAWMFIRGASGG